MIIIVLWIFTIFFLPRKFIFLFLCLYGLYVAIRFKEEGSSSAEDTKKFYKLIHYPLTGIETTVPYNQILALIIGIIFSIVGLIGVLL